jgi:hypothetical protein
MNSVAIKDFREENIARLLLEEQSASNGEDDSKTSLTSLNKNQNY